MRLGFYLFMPEVVRVLLLVSEVFASSKSAIKSIIGNSLSCPARE